MAVDFISENADRDIGEVVELLAELFEFGIADWLVFAKEFPASRN